MGMQLIETIEVTADTATAISVSGIPQTGTDLLLLYSARSSYAGVSDNIRITVNGSGTSHRELYGNGSSVNTGTASSNTGVINGDTATANTFGNASIYISNYTVAQAHSISSDNVSENNGTTASQTISAGLTTSTAAVTAFQIDWYGTNIKQYTTLSIYTITAD